MAAPAIESVQCFRRKKTAVAVTYCNSARKGAGDPLLLGPHRFAGVDMRIRVKGGGHTSQIYAIRQSIATTVLSSSPIQDAASPRSLVVVVQTAELGSRSLTVEPCIYVYA